MMIVLMMLKMVMMVMLYFSSFRGVGWRILAFSRVFWHFFFDNAKIHAKKKKTLKSDKLLGKTLEYAEDTRTIRRGMQNTREKREETRRRCTQEGSNR